MEPLVFESCHSTWLFDTVRMRFRRILKGVTVGEHAVTTEWRYYHGLETGPAEETFTVLLNSDGTRLLRSWRHLHGCTDCGDQPTTEVSLEELRAALSSGS